MNPNFTATCKQFLTTLPDKLARAFDTTATWVTQLSWWKFFLFAMLVLAAGAITQETLFTSSNKVNVSGHGPSAKPVSGRSKLVNNGESRITIDSTGIHIHDNKPDSASAPDNDDVHIKLPPEVSQQVQGVIADAVDDAATRKAETWRETSSDWFMNFVLLLVLGLFGTKALMGGKKRAEAQAVIANAAAEREAMQRQVSEARMQMMQAQVEPHFLFNTLASVEHLIETDPPRAARMQHSLIQYLRAVLPQIRDSAPVTNLGREADMVSAYLELLKMRMEERLIVDCRIAEGLRSAAFPPMMLQSLVENAIKHGLEGKPEGGSLRISAEVAHNRLRVSVADTGLGFGAVASDGTGLGLQNIRERLALMHGNNAQLIIMPNPSGGVIATIEVPYTLAR
ncbi:histidine kinase [Actimicrobium sp. CCC2.4]|uniref:sensor histidine kinase n=1 Tax=Actimicrobium sp. CCC2.4 TaxID=3048606 RepID=UPI002AC95730|nr:histidine kinase [Actimicrobium sp. CCC2.4]MEB0135059.1 histidine kinase [Actimicrobium sp. CCC2.4]WPX31893.1 histidine kinase [Actimicrobium sp. CCC2.4]